MFPVYINPPKIVRRGRKPPEHGKPYDCPLCQQPVRQRELTMFCVCGWKLELKLYEQPGSL